MDRLTRGVFLPANCKLRDAETGAPAPSGVDFDE
jgi:hypothetical protein